MNGRYALVLGALLAAGCATSHAASSALFRNDSPQIKVTVTDLCYDGEEFPGALFVSPKAEGAKLDRVILDGTDITVEEVSDCKGRSVQFRHRDWDVTNVKEVCDELLPGNWLGRDFEFRLFKGASEGPGCIQAQLVFDPGCGVSKVPITVTASKGKTCQVQ